MFSFAIEVALAAAATGRIHEENAISQCISDCRNETACGAPVIVGAERTDLRAGIAQVVTAVKERVLHLLLAERLCADKPLAAHVSLTLIRWCQDDRIELPNAGSLVKGCGEDARAIGIDRGAVHPIRMPEIGRAHV